MEDERLLNADELARKLGVSKRAIWLWKDAGKIPAPVRPGGRLCKWRLTEICQWIADGCPPCRPAATGPRRMGGTAR